MRDDDADWNEMLAEFRSLGGTADNICSRQGPFGRGLFPVDPGKPIAIRIPDNLLIGIDDFVFENNKVRIYPLAAVGDRERAFLERYHQDFSWGEGGRDESERLILMMQELPDALRESLATTFNLDIATTEPSDEAIQRNFLGARVIEYKKRRVVMPIVELANHGPVGSYDLADGVALRGTFQGEVLARYTASDSLAVFRSWGFASEEEIALSLPIRLPIGPRTLRIDDRFDLPKESERLWVPKMSIEGNEIRLSYLMLGNRRYPRLSKGIFQKLMQEAGVEGAAEIFDRLLQMNQLRYLELLGALEDLDAAIAPTLRKMARYQLQTMSFCVGTRQL